MAANRSGEKHMGKIAKCKYCRKYIDKKAKVCPFCNKKQKASSLSVIAVYFGALFLLFFIGNIIFPSGDNETIMVPDWYLLLWFFAPIVIAALYSKLSKNKKYSGACFKGNDTICAKVKNAYQKIANPGNIFIVPKTKKGQEELAEKLLESAKANADLANTSDDIGLFLLWYDDSLEKLEKISMLHKSSIKDQAERNLLRLKAEIQWHICDALNRQKEKVIADVRGKYRNSREFQEKQYESFKDDIEECRARFSEKTYDFAKECLEEIEKVLGVSHESAALDTTISSISKIDFMEGHDFENWCAGLLRKIGFTDVEVTPGSGDQGVDILAVRDGIKYAIQCKCYSSDLGNTPIQEVYAGKSFYNCQIGAVITNQHFTKGGVAAAKATGVLLWDRDWIAEKLMELGL